MKNGSPVPKGIKAQLSLDFLPSALNLKQKT